MRPGMLATVLLLAAPIAGPEDASGALAAPSPAAEAGTTPADGAAPPARLRLGTFGLAALRPETPRTLALELPRFRTHVDVDGWVKPDPNQTIARFAQRWKLEGSIYGRGISIQPTPGGAFNVLPLVDWGWKKWRDSRKDKAPPIDLEDPPSP